MSVADELTSTHLRAAPQGKYQRVMVVVSDGVDTSSAMTLDAVLARTRTSGTVVYVVRPNRNLLGTGGRIAQHLDREHLRTLRRVTDATGGDLFVAPVADGDYSAIRRRIEHALSSTYLLAYSPSTPAAPEAHVTVRIKRQDLSILTARLGQTATLVAASY
jgi:hypothetical protein